MLAAVGVLHQCWMEGLTAACVLLSHICSTFDNLTLAPTLGRMYHAGASNCVGLVLGCKHLL
jgi:hypothetical protein